MRRRRWAWSWTGECR
uniref:Uncharacterized protein n=1 Tax=Arundo donax TaxID=35708 RepID=A0A0A8YGV9_ARUDO